MLIRALHYYLRNEPMLNAVSAYVHSSIPDRSVMRFHLRLDAALELDNKLTRLWNSVCWDGIHRQNRGELQSNYFRSHSCSGEHHTPNTDEWAGFYTPIHCPHHKGHLSLFHSLTLSFILLSICQKISVWMVSMAPLALRELSPGFLELLGSRGCYQKDILCGGLQLICHYRPASLSPREVSVWRMCCGHDAQICMMNLKSICLLTSHVPHEVPERAVKSISLKPGYVKPVSFHFQPFLSPESTLAYHCKYHIHIEYFILTTIL